MLATMYLPSLVFQTVILHTFVIESSLLRTPMPSTHVSIHVVFLYPRSTHAAAKHPVAYAVAIVLRFAVPGGASGIALGLGNGHARLPCKCEGRKSRCFGWGAFRVWDASPYACALVVSDSATLFAAHCPIHILLATHCSRVHPRRWPWSCLRTLHISVPLLCCQLYFHHQMPPRKPQALLPHCCHPSQ